MFTHVMVGTDDMERAIRFYSAVLGSLGHRGPTMHGGRAIYSDRNRVLFMITTPLNGEPASGANGGTIGFAAESPEAVARFHEIGLAHGGTAIEDPPGPREMEFGTLHLAYLRDPDGNKLCALYREWR